MKKTIIIIACMLPLANSTIYADQYCMKYSHDNPFRPQPDYKAEHHVECYCPCQSSTNKILPRGQCSYCGHFRRPHPLKIERSKESMQKLIAYYKNHRNKKMPANVQYPELYEVFGKPLATPHIDS